MNTNIAVKEEHAAARRGSSGVALRQLDEETWEGALEKIEAVLREDRLQVVLTALSRLGHEGVTVTCVHGHGRERPSRLQWRGMASRTDLVPRVRLEMIVQELDTDGVIDAISEHARTGAVGDGKIWVTPVSRLVRVRNGEMGAVAV